VNSKSFFVQRVGSEGEYDKNILGNCKAFALSRANHVQEIAKNVYKTNDQTNFVIFMINELFCKHVYFNSM
jgi:hypothetical protein